MRVIGPELVAVAGVHYPYLFRHIKPFDDPASGVEEHYRLQEWLIDHFGPESGGRWRFARGYVYLHDQSDAALFAITWVTG